MVRAELYKYTNEDGVTVLESHIPARYVKNGYSILSLDGRILEVVPRALTEKEIRERDRKLKEQERLDAQRREKEIADLRDSYGKDLKRVKELYNLDPGR